jgi:cyanophycin synthetase
MTSERAVAVSEVRVLEGPNLYFGKPAIKVSLELPGYLAADEATLSDLARGVGLRRARPGAPGSEQRQRFVMRLVERAVRQLAIAGGTTRLGVRTRPGSQPQAVVVAFVWKRRGRAMALGHAVGPVLRAWLEGDREELGRRAASITQTEPGERPGLIRPTIPVASVTGTNGKTTTTRLLGHIGMTAGLRTAWSSTDGVVVQGEVVVPGDYSGPAGARAVLCTTGVQLGILETARGGLLLKGMGVTANDVSVVTNVSADHLGMQGIDTVDQLAEVKAIVTKVTRPKGWVVLNGEDPRVWAMRGASRARPWVFSLRSDAPAIRESLDLGGRAITVLDGFVTVLANGQDPDRLISTVDVPVTLSGLSRHNVANALAAAAAALGLGLPRDAVVEGLRTFAADDRLNPGRMNTYTLTGDGRTVTVIVDLAHNEAGLGALLDVAHGLTAPGGQAHLGLGLAGDRTDDLLEAMGELAGLRADHVVAAHKEHYLRGRTMEELEGHLRTGLARAGVADIASYDTELAGLQALVAGAGDGDVVALMCHAERSQVVAWLTDQGATADTAEDIRAKVVRARGEHELEAQIVELWELDDEQARIDATADLRARRPEDPRLAYEHASAFDAAGKEQEAIPLYRKALASGLREPHRHRARIQLASSLRVTGQPEIAYELLSELAAERPGSVAVQAFRALAAVDSGRGRAAVADLIEVLLGHAGDEDTLSYQRALSAYAAELRIR